MRYFKVNLAKSTGLGMSFFELDDMNMLLGAIDYWDDRLLITDVFENGEMTIGIISDDHISYDDYQKAIDIIKGEYIEEEGE